MSSFAVTICPVVIQPHPNAERLELAKVYDYHAVVGKGQFQTGDLVAYIPEGAIVPDNILEEMNLVGRLAGSAGNRVKAVNLRGYLSQGLCYRPDPWPKHWTQDTDVAEELGITKWEPPIPVELSGQVEPCTSSFYRSIPDIENIKRYPDVFRTGEQVVVTEKLHGSCMIVGLVQGKQHGLQEIVSSKGIADKHLVLTNTPQNAYWRVARSLRLHDKLMDYAQARGYKEILLFGELLGVQDLMYGLPKGALDFRGIRLYVPPGKFVDWAEFIRFCRTMEVEPVPKLYEGPYSRSLVTGFTGGKSTIADHIREGVVISSEPVTRDPEIGWKFLKSISDEYASRKGGTEYH